MGQTGHGNGDREERTELQFGSRGVIGEFDAGTESAKHISQSLIGRTEIILGISNRGNST